MQIITDLVLDVTRQMPVRQYLTVRQGDSGIRVLRITLTDMGEPLCIPGGTKAVLCTRKADETLTAIDGRIDANGAVNFELSAQTLAAVGNAVCDVQLISGMDVITSVPFELRVKPPVIGNEEILSSNEYSVLAAVLLEAQEALSASEKGLQNVQSAVDKLESTLDKSEEATSRADTAANTANNSAAAADAAKENADTATQNANDAAGNAQKATESAEKATTEATVAASQAKEAAEKVDDVIASANAAIKGAQSATAEAEEAAGNAKSAAEEAVAATESTKDATAAAEAALAEMQDKFSQIDNKQDKDTIVTEAADNTLVLEENQDARLGETSSLVLSMPESIGDWYRSTFSFQSGESATSLVYGYTPLDWKGDDVTSDGRFVPEPFSTYEVDVKNLGINGIRARVDKIAGYSSVDVEGTVLSLPSSAGKALRDYKIYGNSVQDGTPSIETPAILQSVGDYNETTGKYDVTVGVGGANLLDWESNTEYAGVSAIEFDGKQCIKWLNDANAENQRFQQGSFKENTQYTFQLNLYFVNGGYVLCVYTDGSQDYININSYTDNEWNHKHFVSAAGKTVSHWQGTYNGGDPIYLDVETSQIIEGVYTAETIPPCIPYREPVTTTISLDEPLRKVGDTADYIDYTGQKIVRQVEVNDDTGTLPLEESYSVLDTPVEEPMELPAIDTNMYDNVITVGTEIQPSNVKVTYFKKG